MAQMDESSQELKKWDTFFGPDPLQGRVQTPTKSPQTSPDRSLLTTPYKHTPANASLFPVTMAPTYPPRFAMQQYLHTVSVQQTIQVAMPFNVNLMSPGRHEVFCSFCKSSGEDKRQYLSHSTSNCLILQNCVCGYCGRKGHTT